MRFLIGRVVVLGWLLALAITAPASSEHRVALLISNTDYKGELAPRRDLQGIAAGLEKYGFRCTIRKNLDDKDLKLAVERFAETTPTRGTAVFYFAGVAVFDSKEKKQAIRFLGTNASRARGGYDFAELGKNFRNSGGSKLNLLVVDSPRSIATRAVSKEFRVTFNFGSGLLLQKLTGIQDLLDVLELKRARYSKQTISGRGSTAVAPPDKFAEGKKAGDEWVDSRGIVFCWCPPGWYVKGSPKTEPGRYPDETQTEVTIKHGFWISKYELTLGQNTRNRPRKTIATHKNHPLTMMHLDDARRMIQRDFTTAARKVGLPDDWEYNLPSEEQWEYAARAGTKTTWFFGNDIRKLPEYANFGDKSYYDRGDVFSNSAHRTLDDGVVKLSQVGRYKPNPWGLHDVYGNVAEWCRNGATRGGSWVSTPQSCRSAHRHVFSNRNEQNFIGFRIIIQRKSTTVGVKRDRQ